MDKKLSDGEIELLRNNLDYNLMIYNDNFKAINMIGFNRHSMDRTIYYN